LRGVFVFVLENFGQIFPRFNLVKIGFWQFIYSMYIKDMLDEKGQARDTRVHVKTLLLLNLMKNRPVAGRLK